MNAVCMAASISPGSINRHLSSAWFCPHPGKAIARQPSSRSRRGARNTKLGNFAALVFATDGALCEVDAWAADIIPTTVSTTVASAPKPGTNLGDFIVTNCQLSWQGIMVYGTIDVGGGWQSHDADIRQQQRDAIGHRYNVRIALPLLKPSAQRRSISKYRRPRRQSN
jgi:hypothetical protein